jgi:ABC-type lipoprotein export system ATPase subunit
VIVNGDPVDGIERARNVRTKPALISHQTAIASRLSVGEFLRAHAQIRFQHVQKVKSVIDCALQLAADLTGRLISPSTRMTELSNHEIRAILVADAAKVCDVAVLLLDEVEGPATHSSRLLEQLRAPDRIVIMVTNDPRIALLSDCQIVMREGAISVVLKSTDQESELTSAIGRLDDFLYALREKVLKGQRVTVNDFKGLKVPH